jgi:hypothetical protein
MKFAIACLGALALGFLPAAPAFAQESSPGDSSTDKESSPSDADALAQGSAQPPRDASRASASTAPAGCRRAARTMGVSG